MEALASRTLELRSRIRAYLEDRLALHELDEWATAQDVPDVGPPDPAWNDLAGLVWQLEAEVRAGYRTEQELRAELAQALEGHARRWLWSTWSVQPAVTGVSAAFFKTSVPLQVSEAAQAQTFAAVGM